jgi:hypothetical protein
LHNRAIEIDEMRSKTFKILNIPHNFNAILKYKEEIKIKSLKKYKAF